MIIPFEVSILTSSKISSCFPITYELNVVARVHWRSQAVFFFLGVITPVGLSEHWQVKGR